VHDKSALDHRRIVWIVLAAVAIAVAVAISAVRLLNYDPTPPLRPAEFYAAQERWKANSLPAYDIEVEVTGSQPAIYRVEVRDGTARAAFRNGRPLQQQRTFGTWSVPGMFSTMSRDVENVERHARGQAAANTPHLTLRAAFDPHFGYPAAYRRIEWGSDVEVAWRVVKFEPR